MNKQIIATALSFAALSLACLQAAPVFSNHFDSQEDVLNLKKPNIGWVGDSKAAGTGSAVLQASGEDYVGCSFTLPKDTPEGVLTFLIYDPIFELAKERTWLESSITCSIEKDGKLVNKGYSFVDFLGSAYGGWMFGTGLLTDLRETSAIRHAGWTRFDIINPPGAEAQSFIVCVDGHEVFRTREKLLSIQSLNISARNAVVPIGFDEVSYDTDASSYRPNVVEKIPTSRATLQAGAKLPVEIQLDPKGARLAEGELSIKLYDGAERNFLRGSAKIDWAKQGSKPVKVELPGPPRSGNFWVEVSYTEKDRPIPDVTRSRLDVQYVTPGFEKPLHGKLSVETPWDFLPSEAAAIPTAPPKDWSGADSLSGLWFSRMGGVKNISLCNAAWYRQVLEIPADWKGRRILLDIHDPETVVHAFVDGSPAGEICSPGGTLDLTAKAKAGSKIDLALFVIPTPLYGKNKVAKELLGDKYKLPAWEEKMNERGLGGEVALRSEPIGARIQSVAIRTYVEGKRLWAQFECAGLTPGKTYKIEAAASAAGKVDKALPALTFKAKAGAESVIAEIEWENPTLWDVGAPFLYTLNAKLKQGDAVLDTLAPERFGFREILTKGHLMTLNGKPLSLFDPRGVSAAMTRNFGFCDWMRRMGYNSAYRTNGYGSSLDPAFFDEAGIPRRMNASDGFSECNLSLLAQYDKEQDPKFWDAYRSQIEYYMKRFRNSPSVFLWRGPFYTAETGLEMNPLLQDGIWLRAPESDLEKRKIDMGYRAYNIIRALDPSRYQDDLTSLNYNDTINFHCYVGFSPIQEAIERNEHWLKYGIKPVFMDEWASPYITDWTNSPWEGGGGHTSPRKVPQVAEWSAVTRGPDAFARDAAEDAALKAFEKTALDQLAEADKIPDPQKRAVAKEVRDISKALKAYFTAATKNPENLRDQVWMERTREQVLNWRADGVAGMCSFLGEGGIEWNLLPKIYAPVVAFLSGTPEKRTAKDHLFAPGEKLRRSVLVLNNGREPATVECKWKLVLGGDPVADQTKTLTVPGGGQLTLPIEVEIPAGGDRQGALSMTLSSGGKELCADRCPIDVLAPQPFKNVKTIALVDPEGDSAKSLEKIGVKFQLLPFNADFRSYDTIVFGRRAFDYELQCLTEGLDLNALTRLGKNVLVLEQTEKTLRDRFKFRTEYASPRDVYGRVENSPLLAGLSDRCLKFWRGAATLTSGTEVALANLQPPKGYRAGAWYPYVGNDGKEKKRFIKWGNTHNVATVVIIKPDTGNYRTLIDCGFSLNYAAALELRNAQGTVVFNQLDVSGRTQADPAAERYLANLLAYTRELQPPQLHQAAYLGGDEGAKLLESLRVNFKRVADPSQAGAFGVLVLGEAAPSTLAGWKNALAAYAQNGGQVFSLPKTAADFAAGFLPFPVQTSAKAVNQSLISKAAHPLLLGLGNSDFYWKGDLQVTALDKIEGAALLLNSGILAQVPHGKGGYVLCQIQPGMFDVNKRFWLDRSQRFNERTLAGLLSNCGVAMPSPAFLRPPKAKAEPAGMLELSGEWELCPGAASQEAAPADGPAWRRLTLPGGFQKQFADLAAPTGTVWYRRTCEVGALPEGATAELLIGQISGCDRTFINGVKIGQSDMNSHVNDVAVAIRKYALPPGLLKPGKNQIVIRVNFERDNLLGMRGSDGSIHPPLALNFFKPVMGGLDGAAVEPTKVNQWRSCAVSDGDFQKKVVPPKPDWIWVGHPSNSFKAEKLFAHGGPFANYSNFHMDPLPENARPMLMLNGVPEGSVVLFAGKPLAQTNQKQKGSDEFSVERWYRLPNAALRPGPGELNRLEIWTPSIRKSQDAAVAPLSMIVLDDPDVLAEQERQRKLQAPYLHEVIDTEDPYVSRHW